MSLAGMRVTMVALAGVVALGCAKEKPKAHPFAVASSRTPVASSRTPVASAPALVAAARDVESSCTSICERSKTLKCAHAADCMTSCVAMAAGTPCGEPFGSFYRCLVREPVEHWECAEDGIAAIRESFCEKEQERAVGCLAANVQR